MNRDFDIATRRSLLERLRCWDDQASWQDFFDTYWRLIYGVALKSGLTDDEAQDVVQDTIASVARSMPGFRYEPNQCSFKTWLLNMTRWRIVDQIRKRQAAPASRSALSADTSLLEQIADPKESGLDRIWNTEWQANVIHMATQRVKRQVKAKLYQMFYLHVVKELPVQEVARRVGANAGQVYLAKHRVGRLLKREIKRLEARSS